MERELIFVRLDPRDRAGEAWKESAARIVSRAKIPGGWLVCLESGNVRSSGLTFVPDPDHKWDGGSLP